MNIMTIVAGEQQTMNFSMNVNNRAEDETLRGLYNEIGMIEEEHVTHCGSLMAVQLTVKEKEYVDANTLPEDDRYETQSPLADPP